MVLHTSDQVLRWDHITSAAILNSFAAFRKTNDVSVLIGVYYLFCMLCLLPLCIIRTEQRHDCHGRQLILTISTCYMFRKLQVADVVILASI